MELNLETLGVTKERIVGLVVDRLVGDLMDDENDVAGRIPSLVEAAIKEKVAKLFDEQVAPRVDELVRSVALQPTNRWGEKKGDPMTFVEFLTKEAETFIQEPVTWSGKSKREDGYGFTGVQTRLAYMVNQHLHFEIEKVVKASMADANGQLATAITETIKLKLGEILGKARVEVKG